MPAIIDETIGIPFSSNDPVTQSIIDEVQNELLNDDANLDEIGENNNPNSLSENACVDTNQNEFGDVRLRKPIDMNELRECKGQVIELDPAEIAQLATQQAMEEKENSRQNDTLSTNGDRFVKDELKFKWPKEDLYKQRLVDGTTSFEDQLVLMHHIMKTNGKDGIIIVGDSTDIGGGIWKEVIYAGVGQSPAQGSTVRVHYNAYFEFSDEPYDSTYIRRRPFEFRVGRSEVLPGLDYAVSNMQRRERSKFIISSDLLYGSVGCRPRIPANAWCIFVIELISYIDCTLVDELASMTMSAKNDSHDHTEEDGEQPTYDFDKRLKIVQTLRNMGNDEYEKINLEKAIRYYAKGKQFLLKTKLQNEDEEKQYQQMLLKLYLNSAQCYLKLKNFSRTIKNCQEALALDPNNVKALYRMSMSYRLLQQFDQAKQYLCKALNLEPNNYDIIDEFQRLERAVDNQKKNEQTFYYKMFNSNSSSNNK
ncbi:unnamed protein product [Didymodactylos carnosus]|uniref:peptidylprolyl isomerase n=1 Tax=Didymodactylos carnosus TaxID=1234261 RepID=A0A813PNI9_9BILA|nr:unnamed protein product [Didymodactylos carnosus]CAF0819706.1 unnamed protein product [Didymodactylos carnosus]CAF3538399.1 unnamed protein product [Didymodactylos carnosus]CAF3603880.1 unnamed protein product [Didymodactylos carnosus]